ncbi:YhdP family protein, partial [Pseudoalteromonas sp. Angola-18]|uniref:YhdP family protein n=1 Tax=Pseudoalteromonas sp. Angola-18 TaxID=3025338 RepID=UPI002A3E2AC2|nr:TIGR02099 family protein [Pseudoalteromonas sp. Angola-18]
SVTWFNESQSQQVSLSEGGFHLYPEQGNWFLKSPGLAFNNNNTTWPSLEFEAQLGENNQIWLTQIAIALLANLAALTNFDSLDAFLKRKPSGQIQQAYVNYESNQQWQVWFNANNIGWQELNSVPAAQGLRVSGLLNQDKGRISLFGENGTLLTGDSFSDNINYN